MKTVRTPRLSPPLLLLQASVLILMTRGCSALSNFEILHQPASQVIKQGDTATFHCSARAQGPTTPSFDLVLTTSFRATPVYIARSYIELDWMTATIDSDYNQDTSTDTYTASVAIVGSERTNGTTVRCRMFRFDDMNDALFSDAAELTVIGPPDTPAALSLPGTHVDMELRQFSVEWNVPFSHPNHSISHYSVSVNSLNQSLSYDETLPVSSAVQPPLPTSGLVSVSLPFPRRTFSCDILNISVTAVNDIGASQPAYGYVLIPKVPDVGVTATITLHSNQENSAIIVTEIKLPEFCWFESVNYTVVLYEGLGGGETRQLALIEGSVNNPQEPVRETFSAGLVANTNYSVLVSAQTPLWNSSTTPYNFSTYATDAPTTLATTDTRSTASPSVEGISSDSSGDEGGVSVLMVGAASGGIVLLLLVLIVAALSLIFFLRYRNRKPNLPITIEDMKLSHPPLELTPNPIYGGPLYETVGDPTPQNLDVKPELYPLPLTTAVPAAHSVYTESPTLSKHRQIYTSSVEAEESYVQMNTFQRQ